MPPYVIHKRGNKFVVINRETGDVKGTHDSREDAEKQRRLLEGIHRGWKPTRSIRERMRKRAAKLR